MSRNDVISSNSRRVVGDYGDTLGVEWSFKRLTSKYGVNDPTYTGWDTFVALNTQASHQDKFDPDRNANVRLHTQRLRCADDSPTPNLVQGDIVRDSNDVQWAVIGVGSSGPGTIMYLLTRDYGMQGAPDRKGMGV